MAFAWLWAFFWGSAGVFDLQVDLWVAPFGLRLAVEPAAVVFAFAVDNEHGSRRLGFSVLHPSVANLHFA